MFAALKESYESAISKNRYIKYFVKEWLEPLAIALVLALLIRTFIVEPFKIPSGSMRMTLIEKDRILVNKFEYDFSEPERGDVIVFKFPEDPKRDFIKRMIAKGGETVEIRDGDIYVDGKIVTEPSKIRQTYYYNRDDWDYGKRGQKIVVPEDHYFVLGDNSANSRDSRSWGFVPKKNLKGRAFFIYWPPSRWQSIK